MGLVLGLGQILGVLGMHRLALLPGLLLHRGRVGLMGLGLVSWSRGVSLPLLASCWA